jgi:uncharacterized membrane protein YoaT (DUF817 family)
MGRLAIAFGGIAGLAGLAGLDSRMVCDVQGDILLLIYLLIDLLIYSTAMDAMDEYQSISMYGYIGYMYGKPSAEA